MALFAAIVARAAASATATLRPRLPILPGCGAVAAQMALFAAIVARSIASTVAAAAVTAAAARAVAIVSRTATRPRRVQGRLPIRKLYLSALDHFFAECLHLGRLGRSLGVACSFGAEHGLQSADHVVDPGLALSHFAHVDLDGAAIHGLKRSLVQLGGLEHFDDLCLAIFADEAGRGLQLSTTD